MRGVDFIALPNNEVNCRVSKDVTRKKSLPKSKIVLETPTAVLELFVAIFVPCILDFHFDV